MAEMRQAALLVAATLVWVACSDSGQTDVAAENLTPTPSQAEGPFYPVEKPADRDNDLVVVAGGSVEAAGEEMLLSGRLLYTDGDPVAGATIEIWQVDTNGVYLHPDDPGLAQRDGNFQGYGESVTDETGEWSFRTINPGYYEPRPRHIHFKVVIDDAVVLTSQIYFSDDPEASGESPSLVAAVTRDIYAQGGVVLRVTHDIVLDM